MLSGNTSKPVPITSHNTCTRNQGDGPARKLLATLQMRLGQPVKALETLSSALGVSGDDPSC